MYSKLIALIFITSFLGGTLSSQDYISINNGKRLKVEIKEIGETYVVYNLWKNDGIKYRINRSEITDVKFDNSLEVLFRNSYPAFKNPGSIVKSREYGTYLVGEEWIGDFWELEHEFSKNLESSSFFYKAKRQKTTAKVFGISSLCFIGGGFALASSSGDFYDLSFAIGVLSVVIVGPVLGTIGIIVKINSINNKKKAEHIHGIRYVNQAMSSRFSDEIVSLNFGSTQNGIGLVLNF